MATQSGCEVLTDLRLIFHPEEAEPPTPPTATLTVEVIPARQEDTLLDIAREFDIGQEEMMHANPNVSRWLPEEGTEVVLPLAYILPMAPREGLVLNLPEMRLYLYGQHDKQGRRQ